MPNLEQILEQLQHIARDGQWLAAIWHIFALLVLLGLVSGWRPSRRELALLSVPPVASVAILAWVHGNPFNGLSFTSLGVVLGILGFRMPRTAPLRPPRWAHRLGIALVAYGLVYPHFLAGVSPFWYLYAAPVGLVPCPTLALAIGVALLGGGLGSRLWALVLTATGLFYGIFGVARLGVVLDLGLILGGVGLLPYAVGRGWPRESAPPSAAAGG